MKRLSFTLGCVSAFTAAIGFFSGPYIDFLPPVCLFRAVTGRKCIFCGMSHALAFAIRGDFGRAGVAHPLWFLVLPCFLILFAAVISKHVRLSWSVVGLLTLGTLWTALTPEQ
jgi:hypothetical protein